MEKNPIYQFLKSNNLTTKTEEEFIIEYSDRKKSDELFKFMQTNNLTQKTNDEFYSTYFAPVKKKVPSSSVGQNQGTMGSTGQQGPAKNVSSVSPSGLVGEDAPEGYVESPAGTKIEQPTKRVGDIVMPVAPATDMPDYGKQYEQAADKKTQEYAEREYFTGEFKNVLRGLDDVIPIGLGEFVDDMARAAAAGVNQGITAENASDLLLRGSMSSDEDIASYIESQKTAQKIGPSQEMSNYEKIYNEEGKGFWGVVKGLALNPTVLPEVVVSSMSALAANSDAWLSGAATIGTGATYGAGAGALAGGVGAVPGAIAGGVGAIPYAFGAASSTLEMGATFGELLQEELGGKEFNKENVRDILNDSDKINSIRNKAIARGIVIGTIDAFTGKLASGVGAKILTKSAAKSAANVAAKSAIVKSTAIGSAIEAVGGSVGEVGGRLAAGQEMDTGAILLEGLADLPGGIRATATAQLTKPKYKVNGKDESAETVDELISTMTPEQLAVSDIDISNDQSRKIEIQNKIVKGKVLQDVKQANPELNNSTADAIADLEIQIDALSGNTTQTGKTKTAALKEQIKNLQENQIQEEVAVDVAETIDKFKISPEIVGELTVEENKIVNEGGVLENKEYAFEVVPEELKEAPPVAEKTKGEKTFTTFTGKQLIESGFLSNAQKAFESRQSKKLGQGIATETVATEEQATPQSTEEVAVEETPKAGSVGVGGDVKTMDDFDTFKDAVSYNVKRTADIGIDESEANYGDAKNINEIKSDLEKAGIQVEKVSQSTMSDGNYASFDGDKIKVTDENIPLQVLLHEIGEKVVLDLDKAKQKIEYANNIFEAVTTYGASRGNDAFSDNFYLYFLSPKTLKDLSPNVYAELDKLIPQNIKDLGKSLMSKYGVTEQTLKYNKSKEVKQSKTTTEKVADVKPVVSSLKDAKEPGTRITTKAKEILFKGTQSKTKDGKKFSVHNIKQGRFAALDIKLAMDYKGDKPLKQFSIPAGTTIDVVKLAPEDSKKGITTAREIETAAIDASDAQVVKLLTYDSRGGVSEQYIIKDKSILDSSKDVTDSQLKSKLASLKGRIPTQIKRIFDKVKNIKDITYAEQQDIVDQIISDQADMAQVSESIMQELVELEGKGKISQKQSNAIVSRMSKLDKLNEVKVARFIDYASKILNDANYKFKVDAVAAKLKKAKLNIPNRLGINKAGGIVKKLFTMDMSLVPKEVFDKYAELVELMASSSSIIEINKDIDEIAKTAQEVLSVVEVQNGKLETLAQVYQDNKSDKLTYSQNLDKMLVDGIINTNDKEILSKYKSLIDKKPAKKKTEAEIEEEKKELIKGILSERKLETRVFATRAETDLAIQTKKLATKENMDLLSVAQLKTLSKVISNINNGLVDRNTFMLRNRLNANNSIQPVYESTLKAKIGVVANYFHLLKKFGNEKMSSTTSAIRSAIGYNIDAEFGDYKSKDLWENLLERLAIGENLNINKVDTIKAKADKILDKIYKSFYRKENRLVESKAKMFLYKLGLEFKSNPDSDQVKSPEAYLEKTISDGDLDKRTLDMLSDILNDKNLFVDGVLDLDKLYNSFNKYEKEFIALAGKINQEASEYAMFDAGIIQDRPITLLNDYVHHIVIKEDRASEREEATKIAEKINRSMTPTTRAEHLTDREDVVTPLNFDLYNSLISGAKKTYLDYYMTEPIMTSRLVLEGLEAKMRKDGTYKENKDNLQALKNKVEEGISNLLFNNVTSNTLIESISENIATEAYRYMLASGNKLFNELLANFSFVAIYKPADYIDGVAALNKIDMEKFASILINSKSIVTNKLLPKNVLYASRLTEISSSKSGVASKKIKSELSDYSKLVYNQTFKRIKNVAGAINDFTIATSDKIMSIPLWYGSFLSEFNKVSGQNLDVEKFIANDLEYIQKYEKDIELARRYADEVSAEATSIKGAFAGTLAGKNLDREKAGIVKRVYYAYNNFMAGFMQGETDAALKGAKAAVGNGRMSKTDGTRLATAIMARSVVYNTLAATTAGGVLYAIYKSLYDLEDDEYEKELSSETMIDATKKAAISMISGKIGNVGKFPINYAAEYLNEKYFYDGLEEDYKNITYLPKPDRKEWETPSISDWIPAFAAKYGPILTTGNQIYRLYDEEIKLSEKDTDGMKYSKLMELEAKKANIPYKRGMLAISILGQLGYIPAAKNVTKIARREAYRDK